MKHYKADISIKRVGIITAPRIPADHPNVRFSSCLTRVPYPAADITKARQYAILLVEYPHTPNFQEILDSYLVPFRILKWEDWQDPREPESETHIHSCESQPFSVGLFKWIIKILLYEEEWLLAKR